MKSSTKMAYGAGIGLAGALFALARFRNRHPVGNPSVPQPAKSVNLSRYIGRWHEIARYEQRFERGCTRVMAEYGLRDDGRIDVVNSCRRRDGTIRVARGIAKSISASNAKLKVRFFGPLSGDYWVLDHADDYSWSIVGEPSGRSLWLLARAADPPAGLVEQLVERAKAMGYDTTMLLRNSED